MDRDIDKIELNILRGLAIVVGLLWLFANLDAPPEAPGEAPFYYGLMVWAFFGVPAVVAAFAILRKVIDWNETRALKD